MFFLNEKSVYYLDLGLESIAGTSRPQVDPIVAGTENNSVDSTVQLNFFGTTWKSKSIQIHTKVNDPAPNGQYGNHKYHAFIKQSFFLTPKHI